MDYIPSFPSFHAITEASSASFLVFCGIVMACLASALTCVGLIFQKISLCDPANENISPLKQRKYVFGLVCLIVGSVLDFLAFGLAPQSLLAPLAALSLVWNLFLSNYFLNEKYTKTDIYATILIVLGTGISVVHAGKSEHNYNLDDLITLWKLPRMATYSQTVIFLLCFHYFLVYFSNNSLLFSKITNQIPKVESLSFLKLIWTKLASKSGKLVLQLVGYTGFAGVIGGQSLLFAKSVVELVKTAFSSSSAMSLVNGETFVLVFFLVVCLLFQITFLNKALKRFDSLYVIPLYESYWIICGVIGGLVYFGEWDEMSYSDKNGFVGGICVTFVGLYVLTRKETDQGYVKVESEEHSDVESLQLEHA
eukprot:maker-scaffold_41-snap-gene-1.32-mRNA-1 protein AED:0.01 eAED:0.01 QI:421/1/1/1/1/1/3/180/365